jgi:hypothetical protein
MDKMAARATSYGVNRFSGQVKLGSGMNPLRMNMTLMQNENADLWVLVAMVRSLLSVNA